MSTIFVALIVAVAAMSGPLLLARQNAKRADAKEKRDNARQDQVAVQAAKAAQLLLEQNKLVAESATITNNKLDIIHTLVNSSLTASMQAELDATTREMAMMLEVISLKKAAGHEPSVEALANIETTQERISELTVKLSERNKQGEIVRQQQQQQQQ